MQTAKGRVDIAHIVGRMDVQCEDIITEWSLKARTPIHMATHTPEQIILPKQLSRRVKVSYPMNENTNRWNADLEMCLSKPLKTNNLNLKITIFNENLHSVYKKKIEKTISRMVF